MAFEAKQFEVSFLADGNMQKETVKASTGDAAKKFIQQQSPGCIVLSVTPDVIYNLTSSVGSALFTHGLLPKKYAAGGVLLSNFFADFQDLVRQNRQLEVSDLVTLATKQVNHLNPFG